MAARASGRDELWGEPLDRPVDSDVINVHTTLGEELLDIAVGQAVPQLPPHRDRDHLARESESYERRSRGSHQASLRPPQSANVKVPPLPQPVEPELGVVHVEDVHG
jgi:hypothetical protein